MYKNCNDNQTLLTTVGLGLFIPSQSMNQQHWTHVNQEQALPQNSEAIKFR